MVEQLLSRCLYFTANRLARTITKMAEEEFASIGLSPTYAFLLMIVEEQPGITLTELCEKLHIAPSTGTRFVDKLVGKGLVERKTEGRLALMFPTEKGLALTQEIQRCWSNLYTRYSTILGKEKGDELTKMLDVVSTEIEGEY